MVDLFDTTVSEEIKEKNKVFSKKLTSEMFYNSSYTGDLIAFDWVDEIEKACPYIDIIVRRPKIALVQEENVVKIEKSKRINVSSIKDLSRHTENINKFDKKTDSVEPSKILDIRNEETYNIYENRFLYTLINQLERFVMKKEELLNNFQICDDKTLEYGANTQTKKERIRIELKITSESLPTAQVDNDIKDQIKEIKKRLKRIKEYISSWQRSDMMKALDAAHVSFINPPIKKTNIILKNPNFRLAVKLWEFIMMYDYKNNDNEKDNLDSDGNDILRSFLDHAFLIDFCVLDSMAPSKREQRKNLSKYAILLLTEEIKKTVSLLLSTGIKITDEELLQLIAKEIKDEKKERLVGVDDVKKKFKNAMEEYLERTQEYL